MQSNQDSHDLEPGQAVEQINVHGARHGELTVRGGLREIAYDTE